MILPNPLFLLSSSFSSSAIENNIVENLNPQSESDMSNLNHSLSEITEEENGSIIKIKPFETTREYTKEKPFFETKLSNMKRGRKATKLPKSKKNPEHNSFSYDNITSKIQIHFLTFLISFINDCVFSFSPNKKIFFLNFHYKEKSKASSKYFNKLKNSSIKDLLKNMNISIKYKRYEKDINKINLEKLSQNDWFQNLIKFKYLDLSSFYYNDQEPLKEISIYNKTINFSKKTKPFYDLLQRYEESKDHIINDT